MLAIASEKPELKTAAPPIEIRFALAAPNRDARWRVSRHSGLTKCRVVTSDRPHYMRASEGLFAGGRGASIVQGGFEVADGFGETRQPAPW